MRYMKLMPGKSILNASRNRRELSTAKEMGYGIIVVSRDGQGLKEDELSDYKYIEDDITMVNSNMSHIKRYITIIRDNLKLIKKIRKIEKEVISCHDLSALILGYLSTLNMRKERRAKLIYDSHEFEIGRNTLRNSFTKWCILHLERYLIKRCAFSIMVNDTIADEVQKLYKLKERPIVVRSTPVRWAIDTDIIEQTRKGLLKALNYNEEGFIVMYHGGIMKNRGIEILIGAIAEDLNTVGIILGDSKSEDYMQMLKDMVDKANASDRILFHPAVPIQELWKYVGAADVGLSILTNVSPNHYFSLPNKFFENIQCLNPIICSDFPEMKRIISMYDIGITCDSSSIDSLKYAIDKMRTDTNIFSRFKENLKKAKEELCWENEKKVLEQAYQKYLC